MYRQNDGVIVLKINIFTQNLYASRIIPEFICSFQAARKHESE